MLNYINWECPRCGKTAVSHEDICVKICYRCNCDMFIIDNKIVDILDHEREY